jgi:hypothetical protein
MTAPRAAMMADFKTEEIETDETTIFVRWSGSGRPILLLHGFPQTHFFPEEVPELTADALGSFFAAGRGRPDDLTP